MGDDTMENHPNQEGPQVTQPKITVIGAGGGGGNTVKRVQKSGASESIHLIAVNSDLQALSSMHEKISTIQIGPEETGGLGCGADPKKGRKALEESTDQIIKVLQGIDMVFIAAGMGGGTGTGATPQIAKLAKEQDILTVGVVSKPFKFEGSKRNRNAENGIKELRERVDSIIVLPNDNLVSMDIEATGGENTESEGNPGKKDISLQEAFEESDRVLSSSIMMISNMITEEGEINLDFADIRAILKDGGDAFIGFGEASGQNRASVATEKAITNPLVETQINNAKRVLINISGDATVQEINKIGEIITGIIDPEANVILGKGNSKDSSIKVTIIASHKASPEEDDQKETEEIHEKEMVGASLQTGDNRGLGEDNIPDFLKRPTN